ncbi:MAG: hypothetical protein ACLFVP_00115 [Candidatus Bathyarchaeia archaeon]
MESMVTTEELFDRCVKDAEHPLGGWDFSHIRDRSITEPLTWSHHSVILPTGLFS